MDTKSIVSIILVGLVLLAGYVTFRPDNSAGARKISADEAKTLLDRGEAIIVDVRSPSEYSGGHIGNALLLPVADIKSKAGGLLPDKEQAIIVYCQSGRRSANAAKTLATMGYSNVYDLGGIGNWTHGTVR